MMCGEMIFGPRLHPGLCTLKPFRLVYAANAISISYPPTPLGFTRGYV